MELIKFLPLSKGQFAIVDAEDFERLSEMSWSFSQAGKFGYARNGTKGYLHRLLLAAPKGKEVDHINRDTQDCRKSNLRICDRSQNTFNHPRRINNKSGHVGVWFNKPARKWIAEIMVNYKKRHLGSFVTLEEAVEARQAAEVEHYPQFKRTV